MGLFLFRLGKGIRTKRAMVISSFLLLIVLPMPRVGPDEMAWLNGLHECLILSVVLQAVVTIGSANQPATESGAEACRFPGELS